MRENVASRTFSLLLVTLTLYYLIWQVTSHFVALPTYYYARLIELLGIFLFIALALLPLGVDIGTVLSYENLEFTVEG